MREKPKPMFRLGWIEVDNLRPKDTTPEYAGTWLLNLDRADKIHFPEGHAGVAIVYFGERSEALEDANHSRLLAALNAARIDDL